MHVSFITDHELVRQYLEGKETSFELLLNRHKGKIFAHIFNLVKDRDLANDIFQETFIRVINKLKEGGYNEEGKFLPWVMRIAHNLSIDFFRRNKKNKEVKQKEEYDIFAPAAIENMNAEENIISEEIFADVRKLIDYLPTDQKDVIMLRHYSGLSFKEIAEHHNISINTALGRMRYALINLRKIIAEKNITLTSQNFK